MIVNIRLFKNQERDVRERRMAKIIDIDLYIVQRKKKMEKRESKTFNEYAEKMVSLLENDGNGVEYTPEQAVGVAGEILRMASSVGYNNELATPIVKIIKGFGIDVRRAKHMPDNNSGVIYVGGRTKEVYGSDRVIFTDSNEPFEHQRFVMAHELAHYLFDFVGNPMNRNADCAFEETYPRKDHNSEREIRANRFAAELLMPRNLFVKQYNYAMKESDNRIYTVKYLAKYFQVKEASVEKRIYEVLYDGGY